MKNVRQIWQETAKQLEKVYDQREAENISYLLLEDLFGIRKADILAGDLKGLDEKQLAQAVARLLDQEPIQYVTGVADFYGRKFLVQSGALIPRPETEELVDMILKEIKPENPRIMDIGVGSGCIAITLSLETGGDVFGTDVSEEALGIARKNADSLGAKVTFFQHDILSKELPEKELDILVSNPPYIPQRERRQMNTNVTAHEPGLALFVPDDDPIIFYKRIADEGLKSLNKGGKLYFEIHEHFASEVKNYLEQIGYSEVTVHQDMQGKDRMVGGGRG
uniref:peptide chain release factor N(5)-glutamine methyltransferase n=1 Tax=Ekhidna sp. TaxID=2608089 RepID=UPI0032EF31DE